LLSVQIPLSSCSSPFFFFAGLMTTGICISKPDSARSSTGSYISNRISKRRRLSLAPLPVEDRLLCRRQLAGLIAISRDREREREKGLHTTRPLDVGQTFGCFHSAGYADAFSRSVHFSFLSGNPPLIAHRSPTNQTRAEVPPSFS
jgi:hypothetical protein